MTKQTSPKYAPEVRKRTVRMVFEHAGEHASQWAAASSTAVKIGCTPETLRGCAPRQGTGGFALLASDAEEAFFNQNTS